MASGLFQNVLVEWDFVNTISIANYEVYASEIKGFIPDISNLAFRGKTSIYTHQAGSNQQWYFRVRAVNTHGVSGPFSEESMAQTARIISDDILFGPEIAEELRELSKEAQLLADGTVGFNMIAEDVKTPIQNAVNQANHAVLNANTATSHALDAIAQAQLAFDSATDAIRKADDATGQVSVLSQTVLGLQSTVSDKVSTSQFTQLAGVVDTKISTVDADGKFATQSQLTQTANSLTSTITQVQNNLDQVEMTTTSQISQLADNINLRVKENDVVNQINISTEGILIDGKKVHITGQTMIDNAVIATANIKDANITTAKIANLAVGTAAIANAAITNAKIANLSVGTAQLQDAAITNAKIANASIDSAKISTMSADKIKVGTLKGININGVTINGSTIKSQSGGTMTEISGGEFHTSGSFSRTFGSSTAVYTAYIDSYDGALRARITEKRVNGVKKNTQERWLTFTDKTITSQREVHSGSINYKNARFIDFFADETLNGDVAGLGMHIYSGQNTLMEAGYNMDIKTGSSQYLTINTGGGAAIESTNNILSLRRTSAYTPDSGTILTFQSSDKNWQGAVGIWNSERNMHLVTYFGDYIMLRSRVEVRSMDVDGNNYRSMRASAFNTSSSRKYKTNIKDLTFNPLELVNQLKVVEYDLKSDLSEGIFNNRQVGFISEDNLIIATTDMSAINIYKVTSLNTVAIQMVDSKVKKHDDRINMLEIENHYLKQKIAIFESKIA
jgi:hypothetical protein